MSEKKSQYSEKLKVVGNKLKALRYTMRSTLGLQEQPYRERILETIGNRQRQTQQGNPQQTTPQVQERMMNRPRLIDFLKPPQPQQQAPQFSEEELIILEERRRQLAEDAEKRVIAEENAQKEKERQERLKRARSRMSFGNL